MPFGSLKRLSTLRSIISHKNFSSTCASRGGHPWYYRTAPLPPNKITRFKAELVGGIMWWWILWHLYEEPDHILGEFPYPDASKWTDEELGIPPDDYD